jgi:hypothetical protein
MNGAIAALRSILHALCQCIFQGWIKTQVAFPVSMCSPKWRGLWKPMTTRRSTDRTRIAPYVPLLQPPAARVVHIRMDRIEFLPTRDAIGILCVQQQHGGDSVNQTQQRVGRGCRIPIARPPGSEALSGGSSFSMTTTVRMPRRQGLLLSTIFSLRTRPTPSMSVGRACMHMHTFAHSEGIVLASGIVRQAGSFLRACVTSLCWMELQGRDRPFVHLRQGCHPAHLHGVSIWFAGLCILWEKKNNARPLRV